LAGDPKMILTISIAVNLLRAVSFRKAAAGIAEIIVNESLYPRHVRSWAAAEGIETTGPRSILHGGRQDPRYRLMVNLWGNHGRLEFDYLLIRRGLSRSRRDSRYW